MKKKRKRSLLSFLVGITLFAVGLFIIYYITQIIDFTTTKIVIHNDENLWKFLGFLPLLVLLFNGAIVIINGLFNLKVFNVIGIILNIALMVFIKYDLYGVITVIEKYRMAMDYLFIVLIVTSLLLVVDILLNILETKRNTELKTKIETASLSE